LFANLEENGGRGLKKRKKQVEEIDDIERRIL